MTATDVVSRLAALRHLASIPREELTWLVDHGDLEFHQAGSVIGPRGQRIRALWIVLSGRISVRVDRGTGSKRIISWEHGDVTGMLPYSRMTGPPGDNYFEEPGEVLVVHERHYPEMITRCPTFTTYTVHLMLDRARSFNTSDLQDEKMISLGKLAAGLAHELNNPASAIARNSQVVLDNLAVADDALRELADKGLTTQLLHATDRVRSLCQPASGVESVPPLQLADREDQLTEWLTEHKIDVDLAASLAATPVTVDVLEELAGAVSGAALEPALRWVVAGCNTRTLAVEIEQAAGRVFRLVDAVKRFTYMDQLAGPEAVNLEKGLHETVTLMAAKASAKEATLHLEVEANLPQVRASGAELNQVWFHIVDNALDAVPPSGRVDITARRELDRVVVRIVDNGPGIAPSVLPQIFDPFFTTKPPGQGVGLGLDLARRLVRRYHGSIEVQSVPGRTEFAVSIPPAL